MAKKGSNEAQGQTPADTPASKPEPKSPARAPRATKTKAGATEEKVEAVARKARKTAIKVASAVSETVKEIAEKVQRKTAARKKAAPAAEDAPAKRSAGQFDGAVAARKPRTTKTASKATKVGSLSGDVTTEDVNAIVTDTVSSGSQADDDSATDLRQHYFKDQHLHAGPPPPQPDRHLPDEYGDTKLVLLVRDPEWVYAYWEINDETRQAMGLPRDGQSTPMTLRIFKITGRNWPDEAAHYFFDVEVPAGAASWYVNLPEANESWCAELGTVTGENAFTPICRSNLFVTPRNSISDHVDSEWMTVEESFEKITRLSAASLESHLSGDYSTGSESILRHLQRQVSTTVHDHRPAMSSGIFSSESVIPGQAKNFWLQVNTELILYGATDPDAVVTVQGRPVKLNPDGTFSIRYALPDGEQVLKVHATNAAGDLEESVTPVVTRVTR